MTDDSILRELVIDGNKALRTMAEANGKLTESVDNAVKVMEDHVASDKLIHEAHEKRLNHNDNRWTDLKAKVAMIALALGAIGAVAKDIIVNVVGGLIGTAHAAVNFLNGGPPQ